MSRARFELNQFDDMAAHKCILALQKTFKGTEKRDLEDFSEDIQTKIKNILAICKNNVNALDRGHDALNRMILLNKDLASNLTPGTLEAIFQLKPEIGFKRNDNKNRVITIAAVLQFGFSKGLSAIESMPNNTVILGSPDAIKQVEIKEKEERLENFHTNTLDLVRNIFQFAVNRNLVIGLDKIEGKSLTNVELFEPIQQVIQAVKKNNESNILVARSSSENPSDEEINDSAQQIRHETWGSGYLKLLKIAKIGHTDNGSRIDAEISSLSDLVKKCFSNPDIMFDGDIRHFLYDPLHLTACIEQKDRVWSTLSNGDTFGPYELIEEMVKQSDTADNAIKDAFAQVLKIVKINLSAKEGKLKNSKPLSLLGDSSASNLQNESNNEDIFLLKQEIIKLDEFFEQNSVLSNNPRVEEPDFVEEKKLAVSHNSSSSPSINSKGETSDLRLLEKFVEDKKLEVSNNPSSSKEEKDKDIKELEVFHAKAKEIRLLKNVKPKEKCEQLIKLANDSFSHNDKFIRFFADFLLVLSCFALVGFIIGGVSVASGSTFFASSEPTKTAKDFIAKLSEEILAQEGAGLDDEDNTELLKPN